MSARDLLNPADPPQAQVDKLLSIAEALMYRVEQVNAPSGTAFAQFQRAALLEQEVRARTAELERALDLLNQSNARLAAASHEADQARTNLTNAIETVQEGFALFSPDEALVLFNSRFALSMPDVQVRLAPGLSFADYVAMVSDSRHLMLPSGETREGWRAARMARHGDRHGMFNVRLRGNRWLQVSEHRTPEGGIVILQTDVTDIMRVERRERARMLDDQARLIRATLDHLDQGVCIFNREARLVGWNARLADLLSYPMRNFHIGIDAEALISWISGQFRFLGNTQAGRLRAWTAQGHGRPPLSFEIAQGDSRTLSVSAQEMPDRGFVISVTDVTAERAASRALSAVNEMLEARVAERTEELEAALAEAERANASKTRFVAAASHDLLQPLSAAKLFLAAAADNGASTESAPVLGKAQRALESVEHMLGALLDISRLESGRAEVHVGSVAVDRLMRQLADEMLPQAQAKGLELTLCPSCAVVASDATYLRRILQNLLSNAIRYTPRGRVLLGARRRGRFLRIEVHDTGPGIPENRRKDIFREFERLEAPVSPTDGMGLGLAIVERACTLLGHALTLHSRPGEGTCFAVSVPVIRYARRG
ncbi:PAS-domain containing protein [Pseudooceanicola sp. CBS1P-1]|uniref:histidine kinase n=1 Tax=Pseudooceanicola albus TaxID=2692189 RepID=A0A6L7GC67_9RHOB|nr:MULTISPECIES: PAS domain-containing sensor histidine kinase [Pseudooceanicola]MBT9386439.1 PAS-domain containing protein [Pseudooceanicola endophyticus]MXN20403.1 hybrid sensor histidine kinase/response regulator [Pseudooceanicola albus]